MITIHPDDYLRLVNDEREILVRAKAGRSHADVPDDHHHWWHRFTR